MFVIRLIGTFILLIAAVSLIHDSGVTLAHHKGILVTPIGQHWFDISPSSLQSAENIVQGLSPWIWDNIVVTLLLYPGWVVFGLLGAVICYAGRKRSRINIYVN